MRLQGVYTELVTPFVDGRIDEPAVVALIERQLAAGVAGLVVASGAAGEGLALRDGELSALLELAVRVVDGRASVLSGASSNSTTGAQALAREAESLGVDAVIVTAPWYSRPGQEGVLRHFEQIAASVSCPVIVGDAPARTGINIQIPTLAGMARSPNIVGIADASGDMARAGAIRRACPGWILLSGHDLSAWGCLAHGARGLVSLTANPTPGAVVAACSAGLAGQRAEAGILQDRIFDLQIALTQDPSPAAVKWALSRLGYCRPDVRLPMAPWPGQDEGLEGLLEVARGAEVHRSTN